MTACSTDTILKCFICKLKKTVSTVYVYESQCGKKLPHEIGQ